MSVAVVRSSVGAERTLKTMLKKLRVGGRYWVELEGGMFRSSKSDFAAETEELAD